MNMEITDLYQELIVDHSGRPRNVGRLDDATHHAEGFNPLCGDKVKVYVKLEGDIIRDVSFEGEGCAISKASASLMTESIKGKSKTEAEQLFSKFRDLVTGGAGVRQASLGKLAVFSGVREFPMRVKCATLAWHTLRAALEEKSKRSLEPKIIEILQTCYDPEIPVNIYELGLVYGIEISESRDVRIKMTLTAPNCPVAASLPLEVQSKVSAIEGVNSAQVEIVWDPPWNPAKMSEAAKLQLGII